MTVGSKNDTTNSTTVVLSIPLGLSCDKIWRENLFLCSVQIEINLIALLSFCTKPRKSISRQIFSRDGGGTNQVETTIPRSDRKALSGVSDWVDSTQCLGVIHPVRGTNQFVPEPNPFGHSDGRWHLACTGGPLLGTI